MPSRPCSSHITITVTICVSAAYRLRSLKAVEACTKPGEVGALLRREGLYSSLLTNWR